MLEKVSVGSVRQPLESLAPVESGSPILETFFELSPMMMGVVELVDQDILNIALNSLTASYFGRKPDELKNQLFSQLGIQPEIIRKWRDHFLVAERKNRSVKFRYWHSIPRGKFHLTVTLGYIGKGPTGRSRFSYFVENSTHRKEIETRLRQAQVELERRVKERTREIEILQVEQNRLYELPCHLLCVLDNESCFKSVNAGFRHVLGYDAQDLIGKPIWNFIHPQDLSCSLEAEEKERTALIENFENRFVAKDGSYHWLRWTGTIINGFNYSAAVDITDQKIIERALRESEKRLRLSQQVAQIGTFDWDIRTGKSRWTPELEALYGIPPGGFKGSFEAWQELIHPDDLAEAERQVDLALKNGSFDAKWRILLSNGEVRWLQGRGWVEKDRNGHPVRMIGVNIDITGLKNAEEALAQSEYRFRQFADAIPQLGWVARPDGYIYWYNQNWYRYTGSTPQQMEGWGWRNVHDPLIFPKVFEKWQNSLATGQPFEMEFPLKGADGQFRWFLTRISPIKDDKGKVLQWFGTSTDTHEQRQTREALQNALSARDEFLSIASHELKTPLSSLKLQLQLTKRNRDRGELSIYSTEKVNSLIDQTERQLNRLTRLVDDMLDISRIRSGKLFIQREKVSLCELVGEVIDRLKPTLKEAGTPVHYHCKEAVEGYWDWMRLEQVVTNLLTNAMRYGNKKPVEVFLERNLQDPSLVRLTVRDSGIGVAPESLERIFNRFERSVSLNQSSGLGLGLFISRKIVEAHEGRIWVESAGANQGSTFIVELPERALPQDAFESTH